MTRQRLSSTLVHALIVLAVPMIATAQERRLGTEFQVNTYTSNTQTAPAVSADADGDFVVAWASSTQDGSGYGIFFRRFSSAGVALATEFRANTYTPSAQKQPSVAAESNGDFVVVWMSIGQDEPGSYGIFGRRFSSAGTALASEFRANTHTLSDQLLPKVTSDADGDFVVAWASNLQDESYYGIFARRFSSAGTPLATEFQVNAYIENGQHSPSLSADGDGDFVVTWDSSGQDGGTYGIFGRRFSSLGTFLATEFQVNTYTTSYQTGSAVAADADGDFVVAWTSTNQDGSAGGIFARRFASTGEATTVELQVNTYTSGGQQFATVASDADGDFVVAWASSVQDGGTFGVFGRRFSSAGTALATEFRVNTYTPGSQSAAAVAADAAGNFVVTWASNLQDGALDGIFAQRFSKANALDVDGDGAVEALTDGLLLMRYFFGFRGATLISGAVGPGCSRCAAPSIEAYIGSF